MVIKIRAPLSVDRWFFKEAGIAVRNLLNVLMQAAYFYIFIR
jgi:hypothetical protein